MVSCACSICDPASRRHHRRGAGDGRLRGANAYLAYLIKPIIDDVLIAQGDLAFIAGAILVVYLLKGLGAYFSSYLMEGLGHRVVMVVRNQLFRHMLDQSAAFFSRRAVGQLLSRINNDVGLVQRAVSERSAISLASRWCWSDRWRCCSITTPSSRCCA
jgi:ABC-type multidrug transport system fused ATPase/permease subunit